MGFVHIYCGDGQGKTTAAAGMALRFAGAGGKVVFVQFMKNNSSSEISPLKTIEGLKVLHSSQEFGFVWDMSQEEKAMAKNAYTELLNESFACAPQGAMLILDEVISAIDAGFISENSLIELIEENRPHLEIILTGRQPDEKILLTADYISRISCEKHPFDKGIKARRGIEY
ncbi:MAG: cob(I)yrinic acid a,c-diamide adenosyltransferase [Oscillospiraceae bacterium]